MYEANEYCLMMLRVPCSENSAEHHLRASGYEVGLEGIEKVCATGCAAQPQPARRGMFLKACLRARVGLSSAGVVVQQMDRQEVKRHRTLIPMAI